MVATARRRARARLGHNGRVDEVSIGDRSIRLGQFLKLAGVIDVGSQARDLLADGVVQVNGEAETRRGRQLHPGDVVTVGTQQVRVTGADSH